VTARPVIAVDVGSARLGVAVSADRDLPAVPLTTLVHTSRAKDIAALIALARERGAETIVVGYPLRLDGSRGPAAAKVDRFIEALRAAFGGEVVAVDERLTTAAADARLRETGLRASERRAVVDRVAAVEILESYRARLRRGGE
jgi:putative Holliday junction resolvase